MELKKIDQELDLLEQCLHIISHCDIFIEDSIPDFLIEYWDLSASHLAEEMPDFEKFCIAKIKSFLKDQGIDSPSDNLINKTSEYWHWWMANNKTNEILSRMVNCLNESKKPLQSSRLLDIISRYWSTIDENLAQSLLSRCALILGKKIFPLFELIEEETTSVAIKNTIRDYRSLINSSASEK